MIIEGVIEQSPELRFTSARKAVCSFEVGEKHCTAWEELAETLSQHLKVGDKVKVWGYEKDRWWTTPTGAKEFQRDFTVTRIKVLERPKPIENCCYHCKHLNIDCLKECYNAGGGPTYIKTCKVEDGKCAEEQIDNSECWELKE